MPRGSPKVRASAVAAAIALAALLHALPAAAQSPIVTPLFTDPSGDQVVTAGAVVTSPPPYANVDILNATARETGGALVLSVAFGAPPTATQNATVAFTVRAGPTSLPESTADGTRHTVRWTGGTGGGTVTGVPGATAAISGSTLAITLPRVAIGATGGDELANVTAESADASPGTLPVAQDDTSAADRAPDSGTSAAYTFARPTVAGQVSITVGGGNAAVSCSPGTEGCPTTPVEFTGGEAEVQGPASVTFQLTVTNAGLDPDTVILSAASPDGAQVALAPASHELEPGQQGTTTATVNVTAAAGTIAIPITATSGLGGTATTTLTVTVLPPPATREPVPEALGFLTPVVTALGLDGPFGAYAELAFLLFVLLVAVVVVFLLVSLLRTPWVRVRVTPRKAVVAPGGVAEFHVELEGGKARPAMARATLRSDGPWTAGLQAGRDAVRTGETMEIPLSAEGGSEAVLRVQVPYDAPPHERQDLEFDIVPVDADGGAHPTHASRAKVTVEASEPMRGQYASARDIRLTDVRHDPPSPRPGATVRTTATVHNEGPVGAQLRVVLQKDGHAVTESALDVPPHDQRAVELTWQAGSGRNLVKVQIFLA